MYLHIRSNPLKIMKQHRKIINAKLHSFACRNVHAWNSLPENVVHCKSRATFKRLIDSIICLSFCLVNFRGF